MRSCNPYFTLQSLNDITEQGFHSKTPFQLYVHGAFENDKKKAQLFMFIDILTLNNVISPEKGMKIILQIMNYEFNFMLLNICNVIVNTVNKI